MVFAPTQICRQPPVQWHPKRHSLAPIDSESGAVYKASAGAQMGSARTSSATYNCCNVSVSYTRPGKTDYDVLVWF